MVWRPSLCQRAPTRYASALCSVAPSQATSSWDSLPAAGLETLLARAERQGFRAGDVLVEVGSTTRSIIFPESVIASVVVAMRDGTSVEVASVGREGLIGLSALTGSLRSDVRVVADVPGEATIVPASSIQMAMRQLPGLDSMILRAATFQSTQTTRLAACNRLHSVAERVARWMLLTDDRVETPEFAITHERLAETLAVRRPGVTLAAIDFHHKGCLSYVRGRVKVLDRVRLERESCECYVEIRRGLRAMILGQAEF